MSTPPQKEPVFQNSTRGTPPQNVTTLEASTKNFINKENKKATAFETFANGTPTEVCLRCTRSLAFLRVRETVNGQRHGCLFHTSLGSLSRQWATSEMWASLEIAIMTRQWATSEMWASLEIAIMTRQWATSEMFT